MQYTNFPQNCATGNSPHTRFHYLCFHISTVSSVSQSLQNLQHKSREVGTVSLTHPDILAHSCCFLLLLTMLNVHSTHFLSYASLYFQECNYTSHVLCQPMKRVHMQKVWLHSLWIFCMFTIKSCKMHLLVPPCMSFCMQNRRITEDFYKIWY